MATQHFPATQKAFYQTANSVKTITNESKHKQTFSELTFKVTSVSQFYISSPTEVAEISVGVTGHALNDVARRAMIHNPDNDLCEFADHEMRADLP